MRNSSYQSRYDIARGIAIRDAQVAAIFGEKTVAGDPMATVAGLNDWLTSHNC